MMRASLILALLLALTGSAVHAQTDDPCADQKLSNDEVGLDYQGHCVTFDLTGGPVQDVIVSETTDAWGAQTALGILLALGPDGKPTIEPMPYLVTNTDEVTLGEPYLFPKAGN